MGLGTHIRRGLAIMILPALTLPAAGAAVATAETLAVQLLRYAEATGNPKGARVIAEFLAPEYPEEGRTLLAKLSKALTGERWQGVLPRVQERVTALGADPAVPPPGPADEARFANLFLARLDLSSVEAAQAQVAKAQVVFPQNARLSQLATRLAGVAESEKKRLDLEQQGKLLVATYAKKLETLQDTKLPKNLYEERAFEKRPATERAAIFKEEAELKQKVQEGRDILAQARTIIPASGQLAIMRAEVAAMLSPTATDNASAGSEKSAESATP